MNKTKNGTKVNKKPRKTNNRHIPNSKTVKLVRDMLSKGKPVSDIAKELGIAGLTVKRYYGKEIEDFKITGGGSQPYQVNEADRQVVIGMVILGKTKQRITEVLGISSETLYKYYRDEIENTLDRRLALVAANLTRDAQEINKTNANAFFVLKCLANWRDNDQKEMAENFNGMLAAIVEKLPD